MFITYNHIHIYTYTSAFDIRYYIIIKVYYTVITTIINNINIVNETLRT